MIRTRNQHICCDLKDFTRNFKIQFIKGDDFLLKNINLQFKLDDEMDQSRKKRWFQREIAGIRPATGGFMILNETQKDSYVDFIQQADKGDLAFEDLGSVSVSKVFKPTVTDLKLLKGTREWKRAKREHGFQDDEKAEEEQK